MLEKKTNPNGQTKSSYIYISQLAYTILKRFDTQTPNKTHTKPQQINSLKEIFSGIPVHVNL